MTNTHARLALILGIFAMALATGCKDEPSSLDVERARKKTEVKDRSHVSVVKTPVAYGKQLPCDRLLTSEEISTGLGKPVLLTAGPLTEKDVTSVCSVKIPGTPPSEKEQERMFKANNRVLGVLPGDEICQAHLYCGFLFTDTEEKAKCKADGQKISDDAMMTCVKTYEAGSDYRYVVTVLDPDTGCKIRVNPGPSVKDEATPTQCAHAVADLLTKAKLDTASAGGSAQPAEPAAPAGDPREEAATP